MLDSEQKQVHKPITCQMCQLSPNWNEMSKVEVTLPVRKGRGQPDEANKHHQQVSQPFKTKVRDKVKVLRNRRLSGMVCFKETRVYYRRFWLKSNLTPAKTKLLFFWMKNEDCPKSSNFT